jgi:hypothetical protein
MKIRRGNKIPYGTFADEPSAARKAYYTFGYRNDDDFPPLPEFEPDAQEVDPEEELFKKEVASVVGEVLDTLPTRVAKIIRMRFGFGCKVHDLEEIAQMYDLSRERIRQIEAKAIRMLKTPGRYQTLFNACFPMTISEQDFHHRLRFEEERLKKEYLIYLECCNYKPKVPAPKLKYVRI